MTARVPCYISIMNVEKISFHRHKEKLLDKGFTIIENVFSAKEIDSIIEYDK
jgi:hypothetical protein